MAVIVSKQIVVPKLAKRLGDYAIGESVFLNVNGTLKEFLVVNQGIPSNSSLYDSSCNDTWLLMKDIYTTIEDWAWNNNDTDYSRSNVHSYLNDTFFPLFDVSVQSAIKQVKIPYANGTGTGGVNVGGNGLSTKAFVLGCYEVGWTSANNTNVLEDGAKLSYFQSGESTVANNMRIAMYNGSQKSWWLRTPYKSLSDHVYAVGYYGSCGAYGITNDLNYGIRPTIIMPFETKFDPNTNTFLEVK